MIPGRGIRGSFGIALPLALAALPARAADLAGWDRTRWGMSAPEISALYGDRLVHLGGRVEFYKLYSDLVLRRAPLAGLDFTVYFQMDDETGRLAQVLLERRRQEATGGAWRAVTAALERQYGKPTAVCGPIPAGAKPGTPEQVWVLRTTTVRATFLDDAPIEVPTPDYYPSPNSFGAQHPYTIQGMSRRLLVRFAPTGEGPACPRGRT